MASKNEQRRRAIKLGLAKVVMHGDTKRLQYQWEAIFDMWQDWPNDSLRSFCNSYGITYSVCLRKHEFNQQDKRKSHQGKQRPFRDQVRESLKISVAEAGDPQALREMIQQMTEACSAHATLIRARSVKQMTDGSVIANPSLSTNDIKKLSDALKNQAQVMKEILFLAASVPSDNTEDGVHDEPTPVIGKIGVA